MRSVAWAAGLLVASAFLVGSVPFGYLVTRRRLRRNLSRLDGPTGEGTSLRALLTGGRPQRVEPGLGDDVVTVALDCAKVLGAATVAWRVVDGLAPGFDRGLLPASAVGFLSDQVLTVWQSAALWAGAAAVVGHLYPVWLGLRGAPGQAPALALVLAYCPVGFSVGVAAFFGAFAVARDVRRAMLGGLVGFVGYAWLAWVYDWPPSWGAANGPELTLWAAVVAGVVAARTLAPAPAAAPPGRGPQ